MNFECHVTIDKPLSSSVLVELDLLAEEKDWKTSVIDGDPVLGKGPRFYFTCHAREYIGLYNKMDDLAHRLKEAGFKVKRKKIELVMYDTKDRSITAPGEDDRT